MGKGCPRNLDLIAAEVVLGDEVLGAVLACRPRTDLEKAGLGDVAFVFDANRRLASEEIGALYLRRAGGGARLKQSEGTKFAPSKVA